MLTLSITNIYLKSCAVNEEFFCGTSLVELSHLILQVSEFQLDSCVTCAE